MIHVGRIVMFVIGLCGFVSFGGCKSVETQSYVDRDAGQVWTAMKAVAETPSFYDDWVVTANDVAVYEVDYRIEVHRELMRDMVIPGGGGPQRESREMDQTITLVVGDDDDDIDNGPQPIIKFVSKRATVPVRAKNEADLFFADVWELLGGRPAPLDEAVDENGEEVEMIDIDDIDE